MNYLLQIPDKLKKLDKLSQEFLSPAMVKETLGISLHKSAFLLEIAVRYGLFKRQYIVRCKDCDLILGWYDFKNDIQPQVTCHADDRHSGFNGEISLIEKIYVRDNDE